MFPIIHQAAFYIHVTIGSIALIVFWLPIFTTKGAKHHVSFGKLFVYGMYAVSFSGILMSSLILIDPIAVRYPDAILSIEKAAKLAYSNRITSGFLFMLSVLVFCSTRHAMYVLRAKANREILKTMNYLVPIVFLGIIGVMMGWVGFQENQMLFKIFSALSIFVSFNMLRYVFKAEIKQREWIIEHLGSILGAGIGTYTAFFAFGGRRVFSEIFVGNLQMLPWILPSIVGITASIYWSRKYRKQYRVQ